MNPTRIVIAVTAAGALAAPVALGAGTPATVKGSATYAGNTKQGNVCRVVDPKTDQVREDGACRISVRTSTNRKRVTVVTVSWRGGPCSDGADRYHRSTSTLTGTDGSIGSSYGFAKRDTYLSAIRDSDGVIIGNSKNVVKVNGKFKRSRTGKFSVSGTFTVVSDLTQKGAKSRCETGTVKYKGKP
jgi:hypothetical protein